MRTHLPRRSRRLLALFALGVALASFASAQTYTVKRIGYGEYPDASDVFNTFHAVVFGDGTIDHYDDALVTLWNPSAAQGVGYCQWGAGIYDSTLEATWGASTPLFRYACNLKGVRLNGKDVFAFTSSQGVGLLYYGQELTPQGFYGDVFDTPYSVYPSATLIRSGSFGGGPEADIVFANGSELRVLEDIAVSSTVMDPLILSYSTDRLLKSNLGTIHDLEVFNFDTIAATTEVAVLSSNGTKVIKSDGTTLASWSYSGAQDRIAIVNYPSAMDRIACVYHGALWYLIELRNGGATLPISLPTGWGDIVGVGAGDFNGDGYGDVGINKSSNTDKFLMFHSGSTPPFSSTDILEIDLNGADPDFYAVDDLAEPGFRDLDLDGDEEMVCGWRDHDGWGALYVIQQSPPSPRENSPELNTTGPGPGIPTYAGSHLCYYNHGEHSEGEPYEGFVTLYFDAPTIWPFGIPDDPGLTRMEYIVWKLDDADSGADATSAGRGLMKIYGENTNSDEGHPHDDDDSLYFTVLHDKFVHNLHSNPNVMFAFETRLVEINPANETQILERGPSYLRVVSFENDQRDTMLNHLGLNVGDTNTMYYYNYGTTGGPNGTFYGNEICVIHAGCLGIKNGAPTNPFGE